MRFLVTADWHLRPDAPRCRLDKNWNQTLLNMIKYITEFEKKNDAFLTIVGDIFGSSQQPAWVVNMFLETVKHGIIFAGNHDFKYRNMNEIENSSIGHILKNPKYNSCIPKFEDGFYRYNATVMLCHRLVYQPKNSNLAKFKNGISADTLIDLAVKENEKIKWIFIGDNHHKFHYVRNGIHVVNPGSPLIYSANMIGEKCGFYIVDTDKETVEFHEVPDSEDLVTDQYLRDEQERSDNLRAMVQTLEGTEVDTLDFFEICDTEAKTKDDAFRNLYEEVKEDTIKIKTKLGKGV